MIEKQLGRPLSYYEERSAGITAKEIAQQPRLWRELAGLLDGQREEIGAFVKKMRAVDGLRIIFTGAGSSAFIGTSMQMILARTLGLPCEAIATTDIVSAPDSVLRDVPTLLVSYSRSGSSPESMAALEYAKEKVSELYNLVVVCKKGSPLAELAASQGDTLTVDMPPESSDEGFAMTSSVSCMALATYAIFGWDSFDARLEYIRGLADDIAGDMSRYAKLAAEVAGFGYTRLVYLGSGGMKGLAQEGAVKSLELTNGAVNASFDTSMGFRHGPKTMINDTTLTIHFVSPVPFTRQYDVDFVKEMADQKKGNRILVLQQDTLEKIPGADYTLRVSLPEGHREMAAYIKNLVFSQILSLEKSMERGVPTDSPSVGGEVNRVVQGVTIYDLAQ